MRILNFTKKMVAIALSAQLLLAMQLSTVAQADMLGTQAAIDKYAQHSDRAYLMDALTRDDIQAAIIAQGVDPAEAQARLAALSDAEVSSIVAQMEQDSAGASIIGTLFTVFVILLVTDILCLTRVFNFTRCVR